MSQAGLAPQMHRTLAPPNQTEGALTVSLWMARDMRAVDDQENREVA